MRNSTRFEDRLAFFPYGTQYHRAPTPLSDEWDGDLREIARVGYTHVQYRPQWRWHERLRGRPVWDDLDALFDLAGKHGLRVILKPMLETAPDWVFDELGGTRIGFHGKPITPFASSAYYVGGWWPCFDNPAVREAAAAFVREMVKRYDRHPALWMYNAWNEPRSRPLGSCQCAHSVASYRRWLSERHGSIEELNAFLGKAWTSYDSLYPPCFHADYAEMFLWRKWAAWAIADHVRLVADAIRSVAPNAFVMVHVGTSSVVQDPACDTSDDLLNAWMTDRYGTSVLVSHHPQTPTEHDMLDYQFDWMRRVDPSYWCHEFYPSTAAWSRPPTARTIARQVWMCLAGGTAAFTYWQYRSERLGTESDGYGLRETDGSPTERGRVCDGIATTMKQHGLRLAGTRRVRARVALLHSRDSDLLLRIQAMHMDKGAADLERENSDYAYKKAIHAAHVLYQGNGECLEWVVPGDDLTGIRVLHVTAAELIPADTAVWLRHFVTQGGCLVVEFPFACRDDNTWLSLQRPTHGVATLLGCTEARRVVTVDKDRDIAKFVCGQQISPRPWRIDLTLCGGEPIAHWQDGAVAAVRNRYENGLVYTLGASGSLSFAVRWDDPAFALYGWILKEAGLTCDAWATHRDVWIKRRRGKDFEVWFVFNVSEEPRECRLPQTPRDTWHSSNAVVAETLIRLEAGGTWVGELPLCIRST